MSINNIKFLRAISFAVLFFISSGFSAQKKLVLTSETKEITLGNYCSFYTDSTTKATASEVYEKWNKGKFQFYNTYAKSFGVTKNTIWCLFSVSGDPQLKFYLELEKTRLDSIEVFALQNDGTLKRIYSGGNKFPFQRRIVKVNNFIFPLSLSGSEQTYLLKMRGKYIMEFPLKIYSDEKLIETKHVYDLLDGIYIGLFILIIFYNLFVYLTIHDRVHLYYSIYVFFEGSMVLYFKGFGFEFIFPSYPGLNSYLAVLPAFVTISAVFFLFSFLNTKQSQPFLYKLFFVFMAIALLSLILNIIGYESIGMMIVELDSFITSLAILVAGIFSYSKGVKHARLYVIAWSIFLFGVFTYVLKDFNVLPYNNFTCNAIQLGSAFEIVLITVALAQKMNDFKEEKEQFQTASINTLIEKEKVILLQHKELEARHSEKEVMLKEIHHRVKNNLAIVSGILQIQTTYITDNSLKQVLMDCTNRIKSMGLVHESLYRYENFTGIDFSTYLQSLTKEITNSYPDTSSQVSLNLAIEKIELELTTAIPCGLLVTEVLSNTYKHAFKEKKSGRIDIIFKRLDDKYELIIKDDGVGIHESKLNSNAGLGMSLIQAFSAQLEGAYSFTNNNGSVFKIVFPSKN